MSRQKFLPAPRPCNGRRTSEPNLQLNQHVSNIEEADLGPWTAFHSPQHCSSPCCSLQRGRLRHGPQCISSEAKVLTKHRIPAHAARWREQDLSGQRQGATLEFPKVHGEFSVLTTESWPESDDPCVFPATRQMQTSIVHRTFCCWKKRVKTKRNITQLAPAVSRISF